MSRSNRMRAASPLGAAPASTAVAPAEVETACLPGVAEDPAATAAGTWATGVDDSTAPVVSSSRVAVRVLCDTHEHAGCPVARGAIISVPADVVAQLVAGGHVERV